VRSLFVKLELPFWGFGIGLWVFDWVDLYAGRHWLGNSWNLWELIGLLGVLSVALGYAAGIVRNPSVLNP
jgi:hypothetical protein